MNENVTLAAALDYANRGWPVFPLQAGKKVPYPGTHGFQDATTNQDQITTWWCQFPDANVGIATGARSGLVVIDIDPRSGGDETFESLVAAHGRLPDTPEVHTGGGGRHVYFRHPGGHVKSGSSVLGAGIDVKADGGYVVAPPSRTDGDYLWELSSEPGETPLGALPDWIAAGLANGHPGNGKGPSSAAPHFPEGTRNDTLTRIAGKLRRPGVSQAAIEAALLVENANRCRPPLPEDEVRRIARSVSRYKPELDGAMPSPTALPPRRKSEKTYRQNDVGNATRLLDYYGHVLRYCPQWRSWLIWDGTRWRRDESAAIFEYARATLAAIFEEARACTDDKERDALAKHASRSSRHRSLRDMIDQAATMQRIVVDAGKLDADPWLLNVANGTIDLRTGERREHRQGDLLTKIAPVAHDPDAVAPTWTTALEEIFEGRAETIAFFQRWVGYAMTGTIRDHVVVIAYGTGRNGKSTLVETLRHVWGDYAVSTAFAAFTENRYRDDAAARPDIVRLRGARLITTTEGTFGSYLDESTIKRLSGGDSIFARGMRENGDEFTVVGKAILQTNHRPLVRGTDVAIKSRLRFLPFNVSFAGREDTELPEKLRAEAPGILNWAIAGCRAYQEVGEVGTCADVAATTREYFDDMDVIQEFLDEWIEEHRGGEVAFQDIYEAYEHHCRATGAKPLSGRNLAERLNEKAIKKHRRGGRMYRLDVRLRREIPNRLSHGGLPT